MDVDLDMLRDLLYDEARFTLSGVSDVLQLARIRRRIGQLGLESFEAYVDRLKVNGSGEVQQLVNLLTVNETFFFREYEQLAHFAEDVLPEVASAITARGERTFRLLCGACSSGEEAYTLAIILSEMLDGEPPWTIRVDALDIDTAILERARAGRYAGRSVRDIPTAYRARHFKLSDGVFEVAEPIRRLTRFHHVNMVDGREMAPFRDFDVAFCRNLLIYLDSNQRERLIHELYFSLRPGGLLFIAPSESIGQFSTTFQLTKMGGRFVYQKAGESPRWV